MVTKTQGTKLSKDGLMGRVFEASLGDLKLNAEDDAFRKFKLRVEEVQVSHHTMLALLRPCILHRSHAFPLAAVPPVIPAAPLYAGAGWAHASAGAPSSRIQARQRQRMRRLLTIVLRLFCVSRVARAPTA